MRHGKTALVLGVLAAMLAAVVNLLFVHARPIVIVLAFALAMLVVASPSLAIRAVSAWRLRSRERFYADVQGRHHAFNGITLNIEHTSRHLWLDGADLQAVLGTRDRDDVLAARMPGGWRRDDRHRLQLRVDAVLQHLAERPGRMDPVTIRFRTYLEREVLFPEAQRRARR